MVGLAGSAAMYIPGTTLYLDTMYFLKVGGSCYGLMLLDCYQLHKILAQCGRHAMVTEVSTTTAYSQKTECVQVVPVSIHNRSVYSSLCIQLHEGSEDEFLDWPFRKEVKLGIIDPER